MKINSLEIDSYDVSKYLDKINATLKKYTHVKFFENSNCEVVESSVDLIIAYSNEKFTLNEVRKSLR